MDESEFYDAVAQRLDGADEETVREATGAVLTTLAERLSAGEAEDVAGGLPEGVNDPLSNADGEARAFGTDEFEERVGERFDGDAHAATVAVFAALDDAVGSGEVDDVRDQLPQSFGNLLNEAGVDDPY